MVKLISITKDNETQKKYVAKFLLDDGKYKVSRFGAKGYNDYTLTGDDKQRERYWKRHEKDLSDDVTTPGMLSLFILWGNSTDIDDNIKAYKKSFNL